MISSAGTQVFQPEWFNYAGDSALPYAIPKAGFQNLITQAFKEQEALAAKNYEGLTERTQASGTKIVLTEEQKRYLAKNFDPENMNRSEYQAFVDKLCEFGILDEQDKPYVGYGISGCNLDITPIARVRKGGFLTPANTYNPMSYTSGFSSSGGSVLSWAKYLSGLQAWDSTRQGWSSSPEAILFGRISKVLEEIA